MLATLLLLASLSPFVSTDEWTKTFEVTGQPELRVVSGDGNISGRADNRTIRGQINGGGKLLTLRTGDGSIRMEKH